MPLTTEELDRLVSTWFVHKEHAVAGAEEFARHQAEFREELLRRRETLGTALQAGDPAAVARLVAGLVPQAAGAPDPAAWAEERVRTILAQGDDEAWLVLTTLISRAPDDDALQYIGAGPVEDFFNDDVAERFKAQIANLFASDRKFRVALSAAWGLPAIVRRLVAEHPPGPDLSNAPAVTKDLVLRYIAFRRALINSGSVTDRSQQEQALRDAGLGFDDARAVGALVAEVLKIVHGPEAYDKAVARLDSLHESRKRHIVQLKTLMPPGTTLPIPDLESPKAVAWFAAHDARMRETVLGELRPQGSAEELLRRLRLAWGSEAVDVVLAQVEELKALLGSPELGRGWPPEG